MFHKMFDSVGFDLQMNLEKLRLMMKIQTASLVLKEVLKRVAYSPVLQQPMLTLRCDDREQ